MELISVGPHSKITWTSYLESTWRHQSIPILTFSLWHAVFIYCKHLFCLFTLDSQYLEMAKSINTRNIAQQREGKRCKPKLLNMDDSGKVKKMIMVLKASVFILFWLETLTNDSIIHRNEYIVKNWHCCN